MTLDCQIELNKTKGITLTVLNADAKESQIIVIDGSKVTITVKNDTDTSVIQQLPDSISIKCKKINLEAEEISTKTTKSTTIASDGTVSLTSTDTISMTGKSDFSQKAAKGLSLSGLTVQMNSDKTATVQSPIVNIKGDNSVSVAAATIKIDGSATSEISGLSIDVQAKANLTLKGMTTTLQGQLTNIKGSLVNIG